MPAVHVNIAATGDQALVAAPGSKQRIRVHGVYLSAVTAQTLVLLKSGASTVIWSTLALNAANTQCELNYDPSRDLDCAPGEALNINNAASANVRGVVHYSIYGPPQ